MTEAAEKLKPELARLSAQDRAALAQFLIRSLDEDEDSEADSAWDAELARRAKDIKTGRAIGEPADKVFAQLRAK
jgi:putative addiction module component (TIGR02574 family)